MIRLRLVLVAVIACVALVGMGGGLIAHELSHGSTGHTGVNPAVVTTVPGLCPPGLTQQVIGQMSPPNHPPIQIIQCSASIPVDYAPGTGLVP